MGESKRQNLTGHFKEAIKVQMKGKKRLEKETKEMIKEKWCLKWVCNLE